MRAISFRNRILLALILLGVLPTSLGIVALAVSLRRNNTPRAVSAALAPVAKTGRELLQVIDTTGLSAIERRALRTHADSLNRSMGRTGFAVEISRRLSPAYTAAALLGGGLFLYFAWLLTLSLSKQLSSPIDELVGWTNLIRRQTPLPRESDHGGAPEFSSLRNALREMAAELLQARRAELEAERLRAFREVARRVAHEMKNPLTPVRFAIRQLEATATADQREPIEVLSAETARLEQLAKDFSNLGKLPEGPSAEVDVGELFAELLRATVPPAMTARLQVAPNTPLIVGHYDALRRAFANLILNAVEASGSKGLLEISVGLEDDQVVVAIADHGAGIPEQKRDRIFVPYYTDKTDGTGLGLAIVKQSIDLHNGIISIHDTPGGGATFRVCFRGTKARHPSRPTYSSQGIGQSPAPPLIDTHRTGEYRFPSPGDAGPPEEG